MTCVGRTATAMPSGHYAPEVTSRRREGPIRIGPAPSLGRVLRFVFFLTLLGVAIAGFVGWLPFWTSMAAWATVTAYNVVVWVREFIRGPRDVSLGLPRIDPDYSRRR